MPAYVEFAPQPFSGPNLDRLPIVPKIDPIESSGSMFLYDATHPLGAWPAGFAGSTRLPNIFEANATALLGAGEHRAYFDNQIAPPKALVERTGKGGIHVIVSPTVAQVNSDRFNVGLPPLVKAYMKANKGHLFYASLWERRTRVAPVKSITIAVSTDGTWGIQGDSAMIAFGGSTLAGPVLPTNTVGPQLSIAAGYVAPTFDTAADTNGVPSWNNSIAVLANRQGGSQVGQGGARIFYRAYMEDLTVSGRTFEAVKAIDQAQYTKHVLTAGGRYYGDTFTDPATLT